MQGQVSWPPHHSFCMVMPPWTWPGLSTARSLGSGWDGISSGIGGASGREGVSRFLPEALPWRAVLQVLEAGEPVHGEAMEDGAARIPYPSVPRGHVSSSVDPKESPAAALPRLQAQKSFYPWEGSLEPSWKLGPNYTSRDRRPPPAHRPLHRLFCTPHAHTALSPRAPELLSRRVGLLAHSPHRRHSGRTPTQHVRARSSSHRVHGREHLREPHTTHTAPHSCPCCPWRADSLLSPPALMDTHIPCAHMPQASPQPGLTRRTSLRLEWCPRMRTQAHAERQGCYGSTRSHLVPALSSWWGMSVIEVIDVCLGANSLLSWAPNPVCGPQHQDTSPSTVRTCLLFVCVLIRTFPVASWLCSHILS